MSHDFTRWERFRLALMHPHKWAWVRLRLRDLWLRWKWSRPGFKMHHRVRVLETQMEGLRAQVEGLSMAIVFIHYTGNPDHLRAYLRSIRERQERRR